MILPRITWMATYVQKRTVEITTPTLVTDLDVGVRTLKPEQLRNDTVEINRKVEQHRQVRVNQNWYKPNNSN